MPALSLSVKVLRARGLVGTAGGPPNSFVRVGIKGSRRSHRATATISRASDPIWDETLDLLSSNPESDFIVIEVFSSSGDGRPVKLANTIDIPVNQFSVGDDVRSEMLDLLKGRSGDFAAAGTLFIEVQAFTKAADNCAFEWGNYGSDYSTDFTGYSDAEWRLSDPSDGGGQHDHPLIGDAVQKVTAVERLRGKLVGGFGLSDPDGRGHNSYATVQLLHKGKAKGAPVQSKQVAGTADPAWDKHFDFPKIKKGASLEVTVWQAHPLFGAIRIGAWTAALGDIEFNNREVRKVKLEQPKEYRRARGEVADWGTVAIVLDHSLVDTTP
jgi:hypothetical protein